MRENELVSIIVPTYNRAHLIGETIQSVINQTYKNWELIIVDDGSEDDTVSVIKNFTHPRITYFNIEHCGLLGKVRNHGIKHSQGKYIAFLDSDDLWIPGKLQIQVDLLNKYSQSFFVFSNGEQFGVGALPTPDYPALFVGNVFKPVLFENKFCIYPTLVFKKNVLDKIGHHNEQWTGGGDVDFFYRIAYHFEGIFTNERLVKLRKHKQNTSQKLGDVTYTEYIEMINNFAHEKWISKRESTFLKSRIYYRMGLDWYERGSRKEACKNFLTYSLMVPWHWKGWVRVLQSIFISKNPNMKTHV
jgi:glycosyltransferase involved in cell wall biosynthesis